MDNHGEKQSNSGADDKITTFASPAVVAAILDREPSDELVVGGMVDLNGREEETEKVTDSLESSLNDSAELSKLRESGEPERVESTEEITFPLPLETSGVVSDFPKSSTPIQDDNISDSKKLEKPSKPRRPQHIIERNKERVGQRIPERTSYAQVHAMKTRNTCKVDKLEGESGKHSEKFPLSERGSGLGNQSQNSQQGKDIDQSSYFQSHASPISHDYGKRNNEPHSDRLQDSNLSGFFNIYHNQQHGPYYDVILNSSMYNTLESNYSDQPVGFDRGYQSAVANLRQSHAIAGSVPPLYYNPLSTQSAPPGVYGYQRKPLISDIHNLHEEEYYLSSALPNTDFINSQKLNRIPESSLHRKFSSDPYLAQSSSLALQNMANIDRINNASGSYSSLREPSFQYKPYTLKDYKNFVGSEAERSAGGLGPNVDTSEFKEKMRKVSKQREYAAMLRAQHAAMKKEQERKGSTCTQQPVKPKHIKEAETKRQAALNYAKNVPKPKQMASRKRSSPGSAQYSDTNADDSQEITILEILRLRHEKEKKEVDTIRKDLASKIRL